MTITNLHQKTFQQGWGGTCHRKSVNHTNVRPQIKDYTKNNLKKLSKLDVFLLFFPFNYLENLTVIETSKTLVGQAHSQLSLGDFVRFLGCNFFMSCFSEFFSSEPISLQADAPYQLSQFMPARVPISTDYELSHYYNKYT